MAKSFQIRGERRLSCFLPISALGLLMLPLHGVAGAPAEPQARPAAVVASTAPQAAASAQEPPVAASIERIEEALGETGSPLDAVAVDIDNAEYEKAQTFLSAYIRALKAAHHRHHGDLARPLILLGDTQFGLGQYDEALQSYAMAVHVSRVSEGLFTPKQVEAVYKQSEALQRLGDEEEAASREEYAFEVLWKTHGPDSEALLPGIFRLAKWHTDRYNIFAARALLEQALRIHATNGDDGSPKAIPALRGLAETYRMERFPPFYASEREAPAFAATTRPGMRTSAFEAPLTFNNFPVAERALQQVIRIRRDDPAGGPLPVSEAILDLADWHLLWERFNKAKTLYEYVYGVMQQLDSVDAATYFAKPKLLHLPLPKNPKPPSRRGSLEEGLGFVEVAFRVSPTGGVQNMQVVASEPEGMMDFSVRRSLRNARYRPVLVDGQTAAFEQETYRHEFRYFAQVEEVEDEGA